jgi:hypothetical protein
VCTLVDPDDSRYLFSCMCDGCQVHASLC